MTLEIKVTTPDKTELTFKKRIENKDLVLAYIEHYIETIRSAFKIRVASYYILVNVMSNIDKQETLIDENIDGNHIIINLREE